MKKLLKVKLKRFQDSAGTHYEYPKEYDPRKFHIVIYETQLTDKYKHVVGRGNDHEYLLGFVEDSDFPIFIQSKDISLITRKEAEEFIGIDMDKYVEKITDNEKIIKILIKSAKSILLTEDELNAIDSSHPEKGINRSKTLREVLDEYGL